MHIFAWFTPLFVLYCYTMSYAIILTILCNITLVIVRFQRLQSVAIPFVLAKPSVILCNFTSHFISCKYLQRLFKYMQSITILLVSIFLNAMFYYIPLNLAYLFIYFVIRQTSTSCISYYNFNNFLCSHAEHWHKWF